MLIWCSAFVIMCYVLCATVKLNLGELKKSRIVCITILWQVVALWIINCL